MSQSIFESIRHTNEYDQEYWSARELAPILGYTKWENFAKVIEKAILAVKSSGNDSLDWFPEIKKPIISGK